VKLAFGLAVGVSALGVAQNLKVENAAEPVVASSAEASSKPQPEADPPKIANSEQEGSVEPPNIENTPMVRQAAAVSSLAGGSGNGVQTLIALNGGLCGEIVDVKPRKKKDTFDVTCVAYRNGSGMAQYRINGATGSVTEL
jgi:hypothetical protein